PDFLEHAVRFGILLQWDMILSLQRHETRARYPGGKLASRLERLDLVLALVHDQRRHVDPMQEVADIEAPGGLEIAVRAFGRRGLALPFGEFLQLLRGASRHEQR